MHDLLVAACARASIEFVVAAANATYFTLQDGLALY